MEIVMAAYMELAYHDIQHLKRQTGKYVISMYQSVILSRHTDFLLLAPYHMTLVISLCHSLLFSVNSVADTALHSSIHSRNSTLCLPLAHFPAPRLKIE